MVIAGKGVCSCDSRNILVSWVWLGFHHETTLAACRAAHMEWQGSLFSSQDNYQSHDLEPDGFLGFICQHSLLAALNDPNSYAMYRI